LTDGGSVYHALGVQFRPAKLIARWTIDMPWRNFLSLEFRKTSKGKYLYFVDTRLSLKHTAQDWLKEASVPKPD